MCSRSNWSLPRTSTHMAFPSLTIWIASSRVMRRAFSFGSAAGGGGVVGTATVVVGAVGNGAGGAWLVLYCPQAIAAKSIEPAAVMSHFRVAARLPNEISRKQKATDRPTACL